MSTPRLASLRPRDAVAQHSLGVGEVLARYGATNPRLFGSVARGDANEGRDLDLLVDLAPAGGGCPIRRAARPARPVSLSRGGGVGETTRRRATPISPTAAIGAATTPAVGSAQHVRAGGQPGWKSDKSLPAGRQPKQRNEHAQRNHRQSYRRRTTTSSRRSHQSASRRDGSRSPRPPARPPGSQEAGALRPHHGHVVPRTSSRGEGDPRLTLFEPSSDVHRGPRLRCVALGTSLASDLRRPADRSSCGSGWRRVRTGCCPRFGP